MSASSHRIKVTSSSVVRRASCPDVYDQQSRFNVVQHHHAMTVKAAESDKKRELMSEDTVSDGILLRDFLIAEHAEFRQSGSKARLQYLYSDVSQARVTNPAGYASTLAWWSALILAIVSRGLQNGGGSKADLDGTDKLIWHLDDAFIQRLRWEGAGKPSSLGTVAVHESISPRSINADYRNHRCILVRVAPRNLSRKPRSCPP